MKPLLIYVDDEPHNLTVLEAAMPGNWTIHTFTSPLDALDFLSSNDPWVVISDQRMPGMTGVKFLELVKKTNPNAKRVLVTGYSEEDLIIESVRTAQVHDYIRKPWDPDDLEHRISKMVETYSLEMTLRQKTVELERQHEELKKATEELRKAKEQEENARRELEAWAPPFILDALNKPDVTFPMNIDLAVMTFDIVDSSKLHGLTYAGRPVRKHILEAFSELVVSHGGWRESTAGDSAYAHFGLFEHVEQPCDAALAVATEFRVFLRNFSIKCGIQVECGIGLHLAKGCLVDVHTVQTKTPNGIVTQKSFDSSSSDIDLVHRIEKVTHSLSGSNISMSNVFVETLTAAPAGLTDVGVHLFKGQAQPVQLFIKASDQATQEQIEAMRNHAAHFAKAG